MTYEEAREKVTHPFYCDLKAEGAPAHPQGWTFGDFTHGAYAKWYDRQLNAYIKHHYGVSP